MSKRRKIGIALAGWAAIMPFLQRISNAAATRARGGGGGVPPGVMAYREIETRGPITYTWPTVTAKASAAPILKAIRKAEAGPAGYDAINYLVPRARYPDEPPSQLTVGEVLDWQDRIDRFQNSEAVGAYQFMEDTLRRLVRAGHASRGERFSAAVQDRLAVALLNEAGLQDYLGGRTELKEFATAAARVWAGLPVLTGTQGSQRYVLPGESYYATLAGNKARISTTEYRAALEEARG